jgi:heme O synthase-like polyprenyltransferase
MNYHTLRSLVERADKEARIIRGWELYQDQVKRGEMKEVFNFSIIILIMILILLLLKSRGVI